jgi:preprotein translocase subunit YajC
MAGETSFTPLFGARRPRNPYDTGFGGLRALRPRAPRETLVETLLVPFLAEGPGGDWWVIPLLVFAIFYFIVIRPGSRERKQREEQLKSVKKHQRVITNAGIHGTVVGLEDDAVVLRVDDKNNVRIKFSRAAIWQIVPEDAEAKAVESPAEPSPEPRS